MFLNEKLADIFALKIFKTKLFKRKILGGKNFIAALYIAALPTLASSVIAGSPALANVYGDYLNSRHAEILFDYNQAAELLGRVLEARPNDKNIREEALLAYIYAGDYDKMAVLAKNTRTEDENVLPLVRYINGLNAMVNGDYDQAFDIFTNMTPTRLEKFTIPLALAWVEFGRGNFKAAIKIMDEFDSQGGFDDLKALHYGMLLARAGKPTEAEAAFLANKEAPTNLPLRTLRVYIRLMVDTGKVEEARTLLKDYMAIYSDQILLEADMASLMQDGTLKPLTSTPAEGLGDGIFHIASAIYQQSRDLGFLYARLANWIAPDLAITTIFIAGVMEDRARYADANALYDSLDEKSPYLWDLRLKKAENLYMLGETDTAVKMLEDMAEERPMRYDALVSLGDIYRKEERFIEAANTFEGAISRLKPIKSKHFYIFYYAGMTYERAKQWDKAEPNFLKALELSPGNPNILNYLGYSWVEMGLNIEQAQEMIRQAVDQQRHNGYVVDSLGWVYYKIGKFDEAVDELERAVLLLPQDPTINDHLGDAYWFVGRKREARYQWERVRKMNPEDELSTAIEDKLSNGLADSASSPMNN